MRRAVSLSLCLSELHWTSRDDDLIIQFLSGKSNYVCGRVRNRVQFAHQVLQLVVHEALVFHFLQA